MIGNKKVVFIGHYVEVISEIVNMGVKPAAVFVEDKQSAKIVIEYCNSHSIDCYKVKNYTDLLDKTEYLGTIDLTIVASFGIILKNEYLKNSALTINFHPGDIEKCRGRHPLPSAILNKHMNMGITIHLIDSASIDAGPIIRKVILPINYKHSYNENYKKLLYYLQPLTHEVLLEYFNTGAIKSYQWDVKDSEYYKPLDTKQIKRVLNASKLEEVFEN